MLLRPEGDAKKFAQFWSDRVLSLKDTYEMNP